MPNNPGVFDVSEPGKAPANPTSKPVITGSGQMAGDPMVQAKTGPTITDRLKAVSSRGKTIEPSKDALSEAVPDSDAQAPEKVDDEPKPDKEKVETPGPQTDAIKKLVEEKTYFLPVAKGAKNSANLKTVIIVVVVAVVAIIVFLVVKSALL